MAISGTKEIPVILCINPVYSTVDSLACPHFQAQTTGQTTLPFQGGAGMGYRKFKGFPFGHFILRGFVLADTGPGKLEVKVEGSDILAKFTERVSSLQPRLSGLQPVFCR